MRQQQVSRRFGRLFYYDSVRSSTLPYATMRETSPGAVAYSLLNSVVCLGFAVISLRHDQGWLG